MITTPLCQEKKNQHALVLVPIIITNESVGNPSVGVGQTSPMDGKGGEVWGVVVKALTPKRSHTDHVQQVSPTHVSRSQAGRRFIIDVGTSDAAGMSLCLGLTGINLSLSLSLSLLLSISLSLSLIHAQTHTYTLTHHNINRPPFKSCKIPIRRGYKNTPVTQTFPMHFD